MPKFVITAKDKFNNTYYVSGCNDGVVRVTRNLALAKRFYSQAEADSKVGCLSGDVKCYDYAVEKLTV